MEQPSAWEMGLRAGLVAHWQRPCQHTWEPGWEWGEVNIVF